MHFTSPLHQRSVSNICSWHWWQWCRLRHVMKPLMFAEFGNVSYFLKCDMMVCREGFLSCLQPVSVLIIVCFYPRFACSAWRKYKRYWERRLQNDFNETLRPGDEVARINSLMGVLSFFFPFVYSLREGFNTPYWSYIREFSLLSLICKETLGQFPAVFVESKLVFKAKSFVRKAIRTQKTFVTVYPILWTPTLKFEPCLWLQRSC